MFSINLTLFHGGNKRQSHLSALVVVGDYQKYLLDVFICKPRKLCFKVFEAFYLFVSSVIELLHSSQFQKSLKCAVLRNELAPVPFGHS